MVMQVFATVFAWGSVNQQCCDRKRPIFNAISCFAFRTFKSRPKLSYKAYDKII